MLRLTQRFAPAALFVGGLLAIVSGDAGAAPNDAPTTFYDVVAANPAEYQTYQLKLSYTGPQTIASPSVLLVGTGRAPGLAELVAHRSPGIFYGNDDIKVFELVVSGSTIRAIVEALADRPNLRRAGGPAGPHLSLMIERHLPPNEIVFEHLATSIDAQQIMAYVQAAVRNENAVTRDRVRRFRNYTVGPE